MILSENIECNYYVPFKTITSNLVFSNLNKLQSILLYYKWTANIYLFSEKLKIAKIHRLHIKCIKYLKYNIYLSKTKPLYEFR